MLDISVVIPFKDKADMTLDCVKSLFKYGPKVKQVSLVSNNSTEKELEKVKSGIKELPNVEVLIYNHPFNYQKINNWAISKTSGKTILMLNNDVELVEKSRGLIEYMHEQSESNDVGVVGCVLLFGDHKTIQHAGVYLVPGGMADHAFSRQNLAKTINSIRNDPGLLDIREDLSVTAVTGAVTMISRKNFQKIKGMNEDFIICGGDVALGIDMIKAGKRNILVGVEKGYIIHKESLSRKNIPIPFNDYLLSYSVYSEIFSTKTGDPYLGEFARKGKC